MTELLSRARAMFPETVLEGKLPWEMNINWDGGRYPFTKDGQGVVR